MIAIHKVSKRAFLIGTSMALTLGLQLPSRSREIQLIVPHELTSVEGDQGDVSMAPPNFPNGTRIQEVYPSEAFEALTDSHRWITGFAYRPDATTVGPLTFVASDYQIVVSTTQRTAANLSQVFAENVGDDALTVFDGALTIESENSGSSSGPRQFDIFFKFQTPFFYDPDQGNLLIEQVRGPGNNYIGFDHHSLYGNALVGAVDSSASMAIGRLSGTVTQFTFVPEPANAISGLIVVGLCLRRIRRRTKRSD
jgi:hypothetical protein